MEGGESFSSSLRKFQLWSPPSISVGQATVESEEEVEEVMMERTVVCCLCLNDCQLNAHSLSPQWPTTTTTNCPLAILKLQHCG